MRTRTYSGLLSDDALTVDGDDELAFEAEDSELVLVSPP